MLNLRKLLGASLFIIAIVAIVVVVVKVLEY